MAWTTPSTWVDGVAVTAADLNQQIRANMRYLKGMDGVPYIETALELPESSTPSTPASTRSRIYPKANGLFYGLDDAGLEGPLGRWTARVYNSGAISTSTGTNTALTFDSERFDTGGFHSTSVNTGRLTIPANGAGVYLIGGQIAFAANVTGVRYAQLRVNGATYIGIQSALALTGGNATIIPVVALYSLSAADYVELISFQDSGGSLNVSASANYSPEFWIVGPL